MDFNLVYYFPSFNFKEMGKSFQLLLLLLHWPFLWGFFLFLLVFSSRSFSSLPVAWQLLVTGWCNGFVPQNPIGWGCSCRPFKLQASLLSYINGTAVADCHGNKTFSVVMIEPVPVHSQLLLNCNQRNKIRK